MFTREFECPSCGGRIESSNPGSRSVSCGYCGQTSHINADNLQAVGSKNLLIDYGSILSLGRTIEIKERKFRVMGRIRIEYDDGFWDEWYLNYDGDKEAWLQEDDGSFVLFSEKKGAGALRLEQDRIQVGSTLTFAPEFQKVFVTSKSKAKVIGGEGELPFTITPGEPADFIEGIQGGRVISLEVLPTEVRLFMGSSLEIEQITFNH